MADVTARLRLVVDSTGVDRSGRKLRDLKREAREAEAQARRLNNAMRGLAGVLGAAFSVRQVTQVVDQYRGMQNQLRLVTGSAQELESVQRAVLAVANETGTSLDTTVRLYANLERFAGAFLETQQDTLDLTRAINQAAVVSGASVTETSNAIRQLTQGIAGGVLRAEEFNSVMENMPRLGQAIADGLGIGIGQLRQQVNDGLITSERLIGALQSQFDTINQEFLASAKTIGQALTGVGNIITVELGQRLQGVQQVAIDALQYIGANFTSLIPIIEGTAAAVALLAGSFAFSGAVAAITALLSPLGLLLVAVGAVVAMRDRIAEWAFGVRDAGAVAQAAVEVLTPKFAALKQEVISFVQDTDPAIRNFGGEVLALFVEIAKGISWAAETIVEAAARIRIALNTNEYERLIERQKALRLELEQAIKNPGADVTRALGSGFETPVEAIKAQLAEVEAEIFAISGRINERLNSESGFGSIKKTFEEIKDRAEEIANAGVSTEYESAARATKEVAGNINKAADDAERLSKEAREASNFNIGQNLIGDALDPFMNVNVGGINPQDLQTFVSGFRATVDDLRRVFEGWEDQGLISPQQRQDLFKMLEDAGVQFGRNARGELERNPVKFGGFTGGDAAAIQGISEFAQIGEHLFDSLNDAVTRFRSVAKKTFTDIADLIANTGRSLGDALGQIGDKIGGSFGGILEKIGGVIGLIGQVAGLISAAVGFFKTLFGKPSNDAAAAQVNLATGAVSNAFSKNNNPETIAARDSLIEQISGAVAGILEATGASVGKANLIVNAGTRGIQISSPAGSARFGVDDAAGALNEAVRQAISLMKGGSEELLSITKALSKSGLPAEELVASLQTISEAISFGVEPLSEYEQKLREINKVFDNAIARANGVAEAERALDKARKTAIAGLTRDYNQKIQSQIDEFLDGPLDRLEQLLKAQKKRADEAKKRGADLDLVGRLSALELQDFFEGLTDDAINEVKDFLGLFEEASGAVARNLDMSRQDLRARADAFEQFAQQFAQLNTDLTERFVSASPRESLGILRGRATDLLGQIQAGNESAAQALPQVINSLVENARKTFGNTKEFTQVLEFAQGILGDAEKASIDIKTEAERQIAALDEGNDILNDIRDILASSQAFNSFMASANAGGVASATDLLKFIQEGVGLTAANDNASALSITGLIAQSVQPIVAPLANSIDTFTQRLASMPDLQRVQIEATERVEEAVREVGETLKDRIERLELLAKKQLTELENAA